ncbi:MAG: HDOD domain-containing protein [Pseudomonadota bacterium]
MRPQELVDEVQNLFSLPDVALRLNELVGHPDTTNKQIVEVLQLDAGLAATVLRLANSAWYGLPKKVDTLSRAITLIGHGALRDLVLAAAFIKRFQGIPGEFVNMKTFWDNSVACGVVARNLSRRCRLHESEQMFLAGLLHKIGRLVFFEARPVQYREVLARASDSSETAIVTAERQVFGYCYAELGGALLKNWQLPPILQNVVANQLNSHARTDYPRERAILQVAGDMAHFLSPDIKIGPGEVRYAPAFEDVVWMDLGIAAEELVEVTDVSLIQTYELIEIINPR